MVAIILPTEHTLDPGVGVQRLKQFFLSESSHIAYQINWNGVWSTMIANILLLPTLLTPAVGSKGISSFLKVVMLYIKIKRNKGRL